MQSGSLLAPAHSVNRGVILARSPTRTRLHFNYLLGLHRICSAQAKSVDDLNNLASETYRWKRNMVSRVIRRV